MKTQIILFLLIINTAYSQNKVVNKITNKPISYVNISIKKTNKGFYVNKNGEFTFKDFIKKGDTLVFTSLGYESKEILFLDKERLKIVYLNPTIETLDEIVIKKFNKYKEVNLGITKKRAIHSKSLALIKLAVLIKNDSTKIHQGIITKLIYRKLKVDFKYHILKSGSCSVDSKINVEKVKVNNSLAIKLQLYAVDSKNKLPDLSLPLIPQDIFVKLEKNTKKLSYDISKFDISMPKEGVFISLEVVGVYNKNGEIEVPKQLNVFSYGTTKEGDNIKIVTYGKLNNKKWSKNFSNALFSLKVNYPID